MQYVKWHSQGFGKDSLVFLLETKGEDSGLMRIVQYKWNEGCFARQINEDMT